MAALTNLDRRFRVGSTHLRNGQAVVHGDSQAYGRRLAHTGHRVIRTPTAAEAEKPRAAANCRTPARHQMAGFRDAKRPALLGRVPQAGTMSGAFRGSSRTSSRNAAPQLDPPCHPPLAHLSLSLVYGALPGAPGTAQRQSARPAPANAPRRSKAPDAP
jgi:hypothetical protein